MRKSSLLLLLCCLFYAGARDAVAQCACAPEYRDITPHKEFNLADAVFIGKVVEIKKTARDENTGGYIETVRFEVTKAWKRDLETFVIISNKIEGCINGFDEKEEWLVYAYQKRDGTLGTHCCCSRTRPLAKAEEDLKELEAKGERPRKKTKAASRMRRSLTTACTRPESRRMSFACLKA